MSTGFVLITLFLIIISFNFYDNPVNKLLSHLQVWKLILSKVKSFAHVPSASKWWKQNLNPGSLSYRLPRRGSGKKSACQCKRSTRYAGSIPGWGRYPGEGNGPPLQCSCPMDMGKTPWTEEPGGLRSVGSQKSDTTKREHREPKLQQQKEKQRVKCEKFLYI